MIRLRYSGKQESEAMCKALEDFYNDGVEEGKAIGKAEIVASVRKMHTRNYKAEEIADLLDQDRSCIEQILNLIAGNPKADNLQVAKWLTEKEDIA